MRKLLSRWERFVVQGRRPGDDDEQADVVMSGKGKEPIGKGRPWVKGQRCFREPCRDTRRGY